MREAFERRRAAIRDVRDLHNRVSYRQAMRYLRDGAYDTEQEALADVDMLSLEVSDDEVMQSFCDTLETAKVIRDKFPEQAETMVREARVGLGLEA